MSTSAGAFVPIGGLFSEDEDEPITARPQRVADEGAAPKGSKHRGRVVGKTLDGRLIVQAYSSQPQGPGSASSAKGPARPVAMFSSDEEVDTDGEVNVAAAAGGRRKINASRVVPRTPPRGKQGKGNNHRWNGHLSPTAKPLKVLDPIITWLTRHGLLKLAPLFEDMSTEAELDMFALDVTQTPDRASNICNSYTDANNNCSHLAPKLDRACHERVAHQQSAVAAHAATFKKTRGLGITHGKQQQQQQQQQQQRNAGGHSFSTAHQLLQRQQQLRHRLQQTQHSNAGRRGPAASIRAAVQQDESTDESSSDYDDDDDEDRNAAPTTFAGTAWAALQLAVTFWVVNTLAIEGDIKSTTVAEIATWLSTVPHVYRICIAGLAVSKRNFMWWLCGLGIATAWLNDALDGVDGAAQCVFVGAFLLCLRVRGTAPPSKAVVFGGSLAAAYVAAHWSTVFQPIANCASFEDVTAHVADLFTTETNVRTLLDLDAVGAMLAGVSADILVGSFGAAGHEGIAVGLMAITIDHGAYAFLGNTAEICAVGLLFLFHDVLQTLPSKLSAGVAVVLTAYAFNAALASPEIYGHALGLLVIAHLFRWCKALTGLTAAFGILVFVFAVAVDAVVIYDMHFSGDQ